MSRLAGARIGLLEARLTSQLAELVRREEGEPVCAPAVHEAPVDVTAALPLLIGEIERGAVRVAVFLTGAGAASMLDQARAAGLYDALADALRATTIVCRGPKPAAVLRRHGLPVHANARTPHTTAELLEVLPDSLVRGAGVALVHDGGGNPALVGALQMRGAAVLELRSYEWRLPEDVAPLQALVDQLLTGGIDAVAFTNQVQVRHLFMVAESMRRRAALQWVLRQRTIVASIGPTCSAALVEHGVPPHVVASPPKMRPLVTAVGDALAARRAHPTAELTP